MQRKQCKQWLKIIHNLYYFQRLILKMSLKYNKKANKKIASDLVSQWKDAYIDYQFLHVFLSIIDTITNQRRDLAEIAKIRSQDLPQNSGQTTVLVKLSPQQTKQIDQNLKKVRNLTIEISQLFITGYKGQCKICKQFCQQKLKQIENRLQLSKQFSQISNIQQTKSLQIPYLQFNIVQRSFISRMCQSNIELERLIFRKYQKCSLNQFQIIQPILQSPLQQILKKLDENQKNSQKLFIQLSVKIVLQQIKNKGQRKPLRNYIKKLQKQKRFALQNLTKKIETQHSQTFLFGLFAGIFFTTIVFMSILLILNEQAVQTSPIFNRDFATWRGIALIIFYMWVIGIDIYYFQQYNVSHHLVFEFNQHHRTTWTNLLKLAGFFSTAFSILFAAYVLNLTDYISLGNFPNHYLSLIIWGLFFAFLLNPLPILYHRTRLFILKKVLRVFVSPIMGTSFTIGFVTNQILTLVTPFEDLIYTGCYYTQLNFSVVHSSKNICKSPAKLAVFIYSAIFLSYKLLQCIRQGYDKGAYFFKPQFFNSLKYCITITTLVLSYQYKSGNKDIFAGWICFTIISTIYSYVWDLKMDWDLLHRGADHFLLRNKISYPRKNYYFMMIFGLFLRFAWILTLSPNILQKYFGSPQLFRLITGFLQILRRGNWNIIRVQREHLKNCDIFKAIPNIRYQYQQEIKKKLIEAKPSMQVNFQNLKRPPKLRLKKISEEQKSSIILVQSNNQFDNSLKLIRSGQSGIQNKIRELHPTLRSKKQQAESYLARVKNILLV